MNILAIDSTGKTGSYAILNEKELLGEITLKSVAKHGETQMPLIDLLCTHLNFNLHDLDAIAVSIGPGSFTGVRIGISTAKGLAMALNKQIIPVSSLASLAYNISGGENESTFVAPIMDARSGEVYGALYKNNNGSLETILEEQALPLDDLLKKIKDLNVHVVFLGDGVAIYEKEILQNGHSLAPVHLREQRASALGAWALQHTNTLVDSKYIEANYIRKSQAERERGHG